MRARMAVRGAEEARKLEEAAREQVIVARQLRQQAKDMLLTLYAQGQYGKTRKRLLSAHKVRSNLGDTLYHGHVCMC